MNWNDRLRRDLPTTTHAEVIEELAHHARAMYDAARAEGCSHDDAEQRVARQIEAWRANAPMLHHRVRRAPAVEPPPAATSSVIASIGQDLKYASRLLRRQPRFGLLVILMVALGIGSTTTLFSVTYGVLMKPLPWPGAERLVVLKETRGGKPPRFGSFSNATYLAWREQPSVVEDLAAYSGRTSTLSGTGDPERLRVGNVTASLFRVLGARPLIGSLFGDEDAATNVVVLAEGLWRQRFGGDPALLGRSITLDGAAFTVVGVLPDAQAWPDRQTRAWVPFRVAPAADNFLSMFEAVAKLRPGATAAQAAAEGTARGRFAPDTGLTTMAIFGDRGAVDVSVAPYRDAITRDVRRPLIVLLAAVVLLLLIATTNVASLQLTRATARRRELAIRASLGATAPRIARQLLFETLLLGVVGGVAGFVLAWWLQRWLPTVLPADFPRAVDLELDFAVFAFASAITLLTSVAAGLAPARRVRRLNLVETLAEDGVSPVGAGARSAVARTRMLITGGQVAIACVLLVGASLLSRSFLALLHADRGYDADRVLISAVPMSSPGDTPQRRIAVMEQVLERTARIPGVRAVAFTSEAPVTPGGSTSSFQLPARDASGGVIQVQASPRLVSPAYFSTLGLRVIIGRSLSETDTATSQNVVVVNETFARRYLGDDPLSARIPMGVWGRVARADAAVVGVVEDVRYIGATTTSLPEMYFSHRQLPFGLRSSTGTLLVRLDGDPGDVPAAVRRAIRDADRNLAPGTVMSIEDRLLGSSLARPRLYAVLLAAFAIVAVVVTGVGLFGVLSFTVTQRTRELGVRAALGARRLQLVALVVRQGLGVACAGIIAGILGAAFLARFLSTLLYGVTAHDPLTYVAVSGILFVVSLVACLAPSLRAARLDPLRALRS
jgi:predicted permease